MNLHEHQGKELLRRYGVAVPEGQACFTVEEAVAAAERLGFPCVVKAQIHAGGRGKAGGVKIVKSAAEARATATELLGKTLVTRQTGPQGRMVRRLLVEQGCAIARELYLGMVVDRGSGRVAMMASTEGGMEIEEVAAKTPEKILREPIDPAVGLTQFQTRKLAYGLGLRGEIATKMSKFLARLGSAYDALDCSLLEVNPLLVTKQGDVIALDAKVNFDDNALYRHPEFDELRDPDEEDEAELEAKAFDLSYVNLPGSIGCMVNGAGLAMATMDIIKYFGAEPANFLDVGGGATVDKVTAAFKIITKDPKLEGILVNIFGGIMKCDIIAQGVVAAVKEVGLDVPLVVRLEGTNVAEGKQLLESSGLDVVTADSLRDAAAKIVEMTK
jgi:succinyl-CoA synthetase beta subunit